MLLRIIFKIGIVATLLGIITVTIVHAADALDERLSRIGVGTGIEAAIIVMGRPADSTETTTAFGVTRTKARWLEAGNRAFVIYFLGSYTIATRSCVGNTSDC
jgi:hypothetical protein